jgi:hypothetical protein
MRKRKLVFFLIVGSAIVFVGVVLASDELPGTWFGPPDLDATATVVAFRSTEIAIAVTEAALTSAPPSPAVLGSNYTWDDLLIEIVAVNKDAWLLVQANNQFNDPPAAGKRMLLITVKITSVGDPEAEPIRIAQSNFKVVGDRHVVYNTYGEETSCGVVPDALNGVVAHDHSMTGTVCVQVPEDEGNFILVYDRYTGGDPAIYIPLLES